jgi:hypothetical protein
MIFGLFSCQKDELTFETETQIETNQNVEPKEIIVLGNKLENPYSVENMKRAYESLKSSGILKSATTDTFDIETNTLYIRFLPKDSADLRLLWADTTIELFDYPMDYEITEEGFYYHALKYLKTRLHGNTLLFQLITNSLIYNMKLLRNVIYLKRKILWI